MLTNSVHDTYEYLIVLNSNFKNVCIDVFIGKRNLKIFSTYKYYKQGILIIMNGRIITYVVER